MAARPQQKRMLLLGASGRLGRMVQSVWASESTQDFDIFPVFRTTGSDKAGFVGLSDAALDQMPQADAVVALWGEIGGKTQALSANTSLAHHAMDIGEAVGAKVVLHCSSAAVYKFGDTPLNEDAECAPSSVYGEAKYAMEQAIGDRADTLMARQVILRIGNVAGTQSLFDNLAKAGTITLDKFPDGSGPLRSYIAPTDLAHVITALSAHSSFSGPVNIAAPETTAMEALVHAAGCNLQWRPAGQGALRCAHLDTSLLQTVCPLPDGSADADYLVENARATGVWP